jgi:YEATS family
MRIEQSENYQGNDWWEWAVWIDCTPEELDQIEAVTYTLHPSFHPPVRTTTDRNSKFRLEESGWGTFPIYAKAKLKNGSSVDLRASLQLHYPETEKKAPALIRFVNVTSDTTEYADSLQRAILDAAPNTEVTMVKTPAQKGPNGPIPSGHALSIDLTGPAVAALAKGIQSWLARNSDVGLELVTQDGGQIDSIDADNIVTMLQSTMIALRK